MIIIFNKRNISAVKKFTNGIELCHPRRVSRSARGEEKPGSESFRQSAAFFRSRSQSPTSARAAAAGCLLTFSSLFTFSYLFTFIFLFAFREHSVFDLYGLRVLESGAQDVAAGLGRVAVHAAAAVFLQRGAQPFLQLPGRLLFSDVVRTV